MSWLVVGLGNPGPTYALNRHNVGHMVADELQSRAPLPGVRLLKPGSYMNESGRPVAQAMRKNGIDAEHLIVVHDELDIDFDTIRVKFGGGDNGHNGLKSIRAALGTGDFYRVRVGIGRPPGRQEVHDFVLSNYSAEERKALPFQLDTAADAVESLIRDGLTATQQKFN